MKPLKIVPMKTSSVDPWENAEMPEESSLKAKKDWIEKAEKVLSYVKEEKLDPTRRVVYILHNGVDVQKIAVVQDLQARFEGMTFSDILDIAAVIATLAPNETPNVQEVFAETLIMLLGLLDQRGTEAIFDKIVYATSMASETAHPAWAAGLEKCMECCSEEFLETFVLQWAATNLQSEAKLAVTACDVAGKLMKSCPHLFHRIWSFLLKVMNSTDASVRVAVVRQLPIVVEEGSVAFFKTVVFPKMFDLIVNSTGPDSAMVFKFLVDVFPKCDPAFQKVVLNPIIRGYIISHPPPHVQAFVVKEFGRVMYYCRTTEDENVDLLEHYYEFCHDKNAAFREMCAYNIPAVLQSLPTPERVEMLNTFDQLCRDENEPVRLRCAASFHEICKLLPSQCHQNLSRRFLTFLEDKSASVRCKIVEKMDIIVQLLSSSLGSDAQKSSFYAALLSAIVKHEDLISTSWRRVSDLLTHFDTLANWYSAEDQHQYFIPILFRHLRTGANSLKQKCAKNICSVLHSACRDEKKQIATKLLVQVMKLGTSSSALERQSFVLAAEACCEAFGERVLEKYFLNTLITMAQDPVDTVRRRVSMIVHSVGTGPAKRLFEILSKDPSPEVTSVLSIPIPKESTELACTRFILSVHPQVLKEVSG